MPGPAAAVVPARLLPRRVVVALPVLAGLAAVVMTAAVDQLAGVETGPGDLLTRISWWPAVGAATLVAVTAAHYLLGAVSLRAVSALPLPVRHTTLAQLAAAAANRLAPAGIGAAGVNVRFLTRHGVSVRSAAGRVAALSALGAVGDLLAFGVLLAVGPAVGLGGGSHELRVLARAGLRLDLLHRLQGPALVGTLVAVAAAVVLVVTRVRRRRRATVTPRPPRRLADLLRTVRHPRRAVTAVVASAGTTTVYAAGFAVAVHTFSASAASTGALMTAYFVAAAVAGASPVPALVGPAEAALTTALVVTGLPAVHALPAVLAFRVVTFWAPVPVGVWALRRLRRHALL